MTRARAIVPATVALLITVILVATVAVLARTMPPRTPVTAAYLRPAVTAARHLLQPSVAAYTEYTEHEGQSAGINPAALPWY